MFAKASNSKAWKESYGEMCKKTVLRRLCKLVDLDFDNTEQIKAFEDGGDMDLNKPPVVEKAVDVMATVVESDDVIDAEVIEVEDETN